MIPQEKQHGSMGSYVLIALVRGSGLRENLNNIMKYDMAKNAFSGELVPVNPVGTVESGLAFLPPVGKKGMLVCLEGRQLSREIEFLILCPPQRYDEDPHLRYQHKNMVHTGRLPLEDSDLFSKYQCKDGPSHSIFMYGGRTSESAKISLMDVLSCHFHASTGSILGMLL